MFDQRVCFAGPGEKGVAIKKTICGRLHEKWNDDIFLITFGTDFITRSITAKNNNFGIFIAGSCG